MKKSIAALALLACAAFADEPKPEPEAATLGLGSRAASKEEQSAFKLGDAIAGRVNGVVAEDVAADGAAAKAGIGKGDAVLAVDGNRLYSDDDLQDFVRAAKPGQKVKAVVRRAESKKEETVEVTLGAGKAAAATGISWQFAGPAQLDAALALAKKDGKKVLIGISGAET